MRALLVSAGRRALHELLFEAARDLRQRGARVDLVSWLEVEESLSSIFDDVVVIGPGGSLPSTRTAPQAIGLTQISNTTAPTVSSADRVKRALAWRLRKHAARVRRSVDVHPHFAWRRFSADRRAVRLSQACDVIAAADRDAVLIVWQVARRRPDVIAVNGLGALTSVSVSSPLPSSRPTSQSGDFVS